MKLLPVRDTKKEQAACEEQMRRESEGVNNDEDEEREPGANA
jgi:hypothetical protein